jgi:hypothetical protein
MRRMITLLAGAALMLGMLAGPALAAPPGGGPNVSFLRAGVSALQGAPDLRMELARGGVLGAVIADHLSPDASYDWC